MADEHDELPELEPDMAALVAAYEAETARDEAQVEAALEKVSAQIGAGTGAAGAGLSLTAKVGIVGALVGVVGVIGLLSKEPQPKPNTPAPVVAAAPEPNEPEVEPEPPIEPQLEQLAQPEPAAIEPAVDEDEPPEPEESKATPDEPTRPAKKRRVRETPEPADEDDSLVAELALLQRTRKALRDGRPSDALEAAAQHRREFPSGRLAEERDATEVSALCALGRADEARRKASAFERAHPTANRDLLGDCE